MIITGVSCFSIPIVLSLSNLWSGPLLPSEKLSQQFSFTIHKKFRCVVKWSSPFPLSFFFLFVLSLLVEQYYLHDMVLIFCCWSGGLFSRQSTNFLWKQTNGLPNQECNITLRLINESSFFVTNKI